MEHDEFDQIAVGRSLIGDPSWVEKVRTGDLAGPNGFDAAALAELV
jgi:2,4-dienoyl-CoA reductase-like NADH-dependent reductase (Old Yellow Enzyme family)